MEIMTRPSPLRRARPSVLAAFFAQGFTFISLTTRLPQIMARAGVAELGQSLLLLLMVLLAGGGSVLAETLAARVPSATVLRGGLLAIAIGVLVSSPTLPSAAYLSLCIA